MAEYVDAVDEKDQPIGIFERDVARSLGLVLRVSGVLIFTSRGTLLLQRRAAAKSYPFCYDYSAAGHVLSGEEYLAAANRELEEELGVRTALNRIGIVRIYSASGRLKKIHHVFSGVHDGPYSLCTEEVESVHEFTLSRIRSCLSESPQLFTPSFGTVFASTIAR